MAAEKNVVTKRYSSSFVLDRAKLSRMLGILEDKFGSAQLEFKQNYQVLDSKGKNVNLSELEDVLKLDNPVRNPITSFTIKAEGTSEDKSASCQIRYENDDSRNISLTVTSHDAKWANQLFAEIEEQIERTFVSGWARVFDKSIKIFNTNHLTVIVYTLALILFALATAISFILNPALTANSTTETAQLIQEAEQLTTTEEKINFLFEQKIRELQESLPADQAPALNLRELLTLRNFFLILPFLILFGCLGYLFMYSYPHAVFLWGDYEEHYQGILSTRNKLWNAVILTILIGVIVNGFSTAITDFITD